MLQPFHIPRIPLSSLPWRVLSSLITGLTGLTTGLPLRAELFAPPGDGSPADTVPAGSRSGGESRSLGRASCGPEELPISPITPALQTLTSPNPYPTLLFQVPSTSAQKVILLWFDESEQDLGMVEIPFDQLEKQDETDQGSTIALPWPRDYVPLASPQTYFWRVIFACGEFAGPDDPNFRGTMQLVQDES